MDESAFIWLLMQSTLSAHHNYYERNFVIRRNVDGCSFVIAFTDEDLANRFIEVDGNQDLELLELSCQETWIIYLEELVKIGCEYIGFDPKKDGNTANFEKITDLLVRIQKVFR